MYLGRGANPFHPQRPWSSKVHAQEVEYMLCGWTRYMRQQCHRDVHGDIEVSCLSLRISHPAIITIRSHYYDCSKGLANVLTCLLTRCGILGSEIRSYAVWSHGRCGVAVKLRSAERHSFQPKDTSLQLLIRRSHPPPWRIERPAGKHRNGIMPEF